MFQRSVYTLIGGLALLCALAEAGVPQISCSFTAEIRQVNTEQPGDLKFEGHYMQYAIENVGWSQVGNLVAMYPGNSTTIYREPGMFTIIDPFLERHVCATLPTVPPFMGCFQVPEDSTLIQEEVSCEVYPNHTCELWLHVEKASGMVHYIYVRKDTPQPIPDHYYVDGSYLGQTQQYDFISFDPVAPPESRLEIPSTQPCLDLTKDSNVKSMFEMKTFSGPLTFLEQGNPLADTLINDPKSIERIRTMMGPNAKWKAGPNPFFEGKTLRDFADMLIRPGMRRYERSGAPKTRSYSHGGKRKPLKIADDIPTHFDAREQWPKCGIENIRQQGHCGSCWAFGSSEEFADRICISQGQSTVVQLSPQYMIDCYSREHACGGGFGDVTHEYLRDVGVPLEECVPYKETVLNCTNVCADGSPMKLFRMSEVYDLFAPFDYNKTVSLIQTEIMTHGPVEAEFYVFDDFGDYVSGIYQHTPGSSFCGAHVIKIIGWGEENGVPYWTIANSFGPDWGEKGFFRMLRGTNECGIENSVVCGIPDL